MEFKGDVLMALYGLLTAILMIINAIICFRGFCLVLEIRDYVASVLIIVSSLMLMLAEVNHYLKKYPFSRYTNNAVLFLKHRTGRGIFYIVNGALGLTENKYMVAIGMFAIACGVANLVVAIVLIQKVKEGNQNMEVVELPNKAAFEELQQLEEANAKLKTTVAL